MFRATLFALLASIAAGSGVTGQTVRTVRLITTDDVGILASYYPASRGPAPVVVLLHNLGRTRAQWDDFAPRLQREGIAVLAPDLRGHGESTARITAAGRQPLDVRAFKPSDFQDMLFDLEAAVDWLSEQPDIDGDKIAVVGSSLSANVALRYATINEDLAALVLLSPGIVYRGVRADDAMKTLRKMSLLIVTSRYDAFAFESSKQLDRIRREAGPPRAAEELWVCGGNAHGALLLSAVKNLPERLAGWLKDSLVGPGSQ